MNKQEKLYDLDDVIVLLQKVAPHITNNIGEKDELYADIGLDSREFIHIIREIELILKNDVDDEDLLEAQLITVHDLIDFINKLQIRFNVG